jgi:hypothetical protein
VLAGLSTEAESLGAAWALAAGAIGAFAALLYFGAGVLAPGERRLLCLAVLGPAACQMLAPALIPPEEPQPALFLVAALALACYAVPCAVGLWRAARLARFHAAAANAVLTALGLAVFTIAMTFGFLVYWPADTVLAVRALAVLISLAGLPILVAGLLIHEGLAAEPQRGGQRLLGTAVALLGMTILAGSIALAWPEPLPVLALGLVNFAALTFLGIRFRFWTAHALALAALAVGFLTAYHLLANLIAGAAELDLNREMLSSSSGSALLVLVVLLAGAAELRMRGGSAVDAWCYALGSLILGAISLALTTTHGAAAPGSAAVAFVVCGATALAANWRWRRQALSYAGLALLVAATLWGLPWETPNAWGGWSFVVAIEAAALACLALALRLNRVRAGWAERYANACRDLAGITASAALLLALPSAPFTIWPAATAALLAGIACLLAWAYQQPLLTWVGAALFFAALLRLLFGDLNAELTSLPWLLALLLHASLLLAVSLLIDWLRRGGGANGADWRASWQRVRRGGRPPGIKDAWRREKTLQ